ncbi:conserved exported protein of unknown function [Candidatus Filomicrobium marinum]|uniref:Uncharacterized protein n=1 Tax=Candidatus Filomicrobium marinum TaxID=1608628 RepID=A0A0D6JAU2_9HYPH|nr:MULTISPECIES: hypothetical protein [Filomicrobium]MCV0368657.1 hypothetical protein [Filomicrobium sp.]CFX00481.1 conserved exported protein of unknown function [Candidatus Filomicrobium marinum]CPR15243.1 conserved exported protein of unknown function [Candidatus Filomicrobium marinum]
MSALIPGSRVLGGIAALVMLGLASTSVSALPLNPAVSSTKSTAENDSLLLKVGRRYYYGDGDYYAYRPYRYYRYRPYRRYGYVYSATPYYYDDDYYYRPYVRRRYRGGLYIRAPFVDLYIP